MDRGDGRNDDEILDCHWDATSGLGRGMLQRNNARCPARFQIPRVAARGGGYSLSVLNVSHAPMLPASYPMRNQRCRWSDVPWLKLSGTT